MSKLTAAKRRALPSSEFALPGRRYPVDTPGRAVAAKARASEFLSGEEKARVFAAANRVLHNRPMSLRSMYRNNSR